jgi:succinate dehydrogenase / fumarate reductase cytochrome b subunit
MQLREALASSVGGKFIVACTGLALVIFLVAHLAGNLLFIAGPDAFNRYSHALISNPLVYVAEAGLLAVFVVHALRTIALVLTNRAARPGRYAVRRWATAKNPRSRKSLASTTMILTGAITVLFVVTHLATFKFGPFYESSDGIRDLYRLQLEIFASPGYVLFYLAAMGVILLHLWHGVTSAAQSLGVTHPVWSPRLLVAGRVLSAVIGGGFLVLPIYTFFVARSVR